VLQIFISDVLEENSSNPGNSVALTMLGLGPSMPKVNILSTYKIKRVTVFSLNICYCISTKFVLVYTLLKLSFTRFLKTCF